MKRKLIALALALILTLSLCACGGAGAQETKNAEVLKGVYEALIAPDSGYSENKASLLEYYPDLEYGETLGEDRITLSFKANGNEYFSDGSWDFVQEGDRLNAVIADADYTGLVNVIFVAGAIGSYYGMDPALVSGYLNGLSVLGIESENFSMSEGEGGTTYSLNIAGPWDMKELDQMVLNESVLGGEPLGEGFISQGGSFGKLQYFAHGNEKSFTLLVGEYGGLDETACRSIVNFVTLRRPAGWESFLADFSELKELACEEYEVDLDPDDSVKDEITGSWSESYRYALLRFGSEEASEGGYEVLAPDHDALAYCFFRVVAGYHHGTAGSSLAEASAACDVLSFAADAELWLADTEALRANLQEAWESLDDDEREVFRINFPSLEELLNSCFEDWDAQRPRFEDAGAAELMDGLVADGAAQWSWEALCECARALIEGD